MCWCKWRRYGIFYKQKQIIDFCDWPILYVLQFCLTSVWSVLIINMSVKMQHRHNHFRVLQSDWLINSVCKKEPWLEMTTASYGSHSKPAYSLAGICQALWQLFQPSIQFKYPTWSFVIGYLDVVQVNCISFNGFLGNVFYSFQLKTFLLKRSSQKTFLFQNLF